MISKVRLLVLFFQVNRTTIKTKIAIPVTARQDKGNYKLVAENCHGVAQHVIRVEILGENQIFPQQLFINLFHSYRFDETSILFSTLSNLTMHFQTAPFHQGMLLCQTSKQTLAT